MDCIGNESSLAMDWWHRGRGQWRGRPAEVTVQNFPAEHQQGPETRVEPDPLITLYRLSRLSMIKVQPVVRVSRENRATLHPILFLAPMPRSIVKPKIMWNHKLIEFVPAKAQSSYWVPRSSQAWAFHAASMSTPLHTQ